jgi:HK97 gp10 family phage protein
MAVGARVEFKLNLKDQAKLLAAYKRVGEVAGQKALRRIADDAVDPMLAAVRANTPVGETGNLRRHNKEQLWSGFRSRVVWEVANTANHAHLVEFGHRQVAGGRLEKGGKIIGSVPPHPFFRPAVDATKNIVQDRAAKGVGRFVDRAYER